MFISDTPQYTIDLDTPEADRWADVIAAEKTSAGKLIQRAAADIERVPRVCRWGFGKLYQAFGGLYQGEIKAWAAGLGVTAGTATMLNCLYELSHLPNPFGCTAGIRWLDGCGMVHVRTLDWPIDGMGEATRLFRFRRANREFVAVGVPGQVGVLSGMLPGASSVTINWAPPAAFPTFDFGPTFLLRDVLETCDTYASAVETLERTQLSTSVFFTVCGVERNQACVVERTQRRAAVRPLNGPVLVQANHHIADAFAKNNDAILKVPPEEEVFSLDGSTKRVNILESALATLPADCSLEDTVHALDIPTVLNSQTCQKMVFCPRTGELKVWRLVSTH
jgi:predicted choloylglycine hydrolase